MTATNGGKADIFEALCIAVDIVGYTRNSERAQLRLQQELVDLLARGRAVAGLDDHVIDRQSEGDSELAILAPPTEPSGPAIERFIGDVVDRLFSRNRGRPADHRLRIRMALSRGVLTRAANGYTGVAVVTVARLRDSAPVRDALRDAPTASLAVVMSDDLYREFVEEVGTGRASQTFHRVDVEVKGFHAPAWLAVPEFDGQSAPPANGPARRGLRRLIVAASILVVAAASVGIAALERGPGRTPAGLPPAPVTPGFLAESGPSPATELSATCSAGRAEVRGEKLAPKYAGQQLDLVVNGQPPGDDRVFTVAADGHFARSFNALTFLQNGNRHLRIEVTTTTLQVIDAPWDVVETDCA